MSDDERRWRLAHHEAGHAVLAYWLLGEASVKAVSLRPGKSHSAATYLADADDRPIADHILVDLAGSIAACMAEPMGKDMATETRPVAELAAASFERLPPAHRERLLAAEAVPFEPDQTDEAKALEGALLLAEVNRGDAVEAGLHLSYLRAVATRWVRLHLNAIRAVAAELFRHTTIDGATVAARVRSSRCVCHGWPPPAG